MTEREREREREKLIAARYNMNARRKTNEMKQFDYHKTISHLKTNA